MEIGVNQNHRAETARLGLNRVPRAAYDANPAMATMSCSQEYQCLALRQSRQSEASHSQKAAELWGVPVDV